MSVVQPNQMDFSAKKFSMIVSGSPGIGKTTLALSAPDPILIDVDRGISRVQARHRKPAIIGDTYEEILSDITSSPEVKAAQTLIVDTGGAFVTLLQDWAMRQNPTVNRQKNGAISLKGFGAVKAEFTRFTNLLQYTMDKNIIYVFHTLEERDDDTTKQRLMCEGAARNIVWQPCDLGCHLQLVGDKRFMGFTPTEQYFAKGCYGIKGLIEVPELTDDIPNNLISLLFDQARANIANENRFFEAEKERYDSAVRQVDELIETVVDDESAKAAAQQIKKIPHALTSEREARAKFAKGIKSLGLKWDKERREYIGHD